MRDDWDSYFLNLADYAASRATCPRLRVGCVLTLANRVICSGYNGSLPGDFHCDREGVGCDLVGGSCQRVIHAEANAIAQAALFGVSVRTATAYVSHEPCWHCFRLLVSCGIRQIIYRRPYGSDPRAQQAAERLDVQLTMLAPPL